jgi:hypothetical protein
MPGYIAGALRRFQDTAPAKAEHSPYPWQRPEYGAKTHFAPLPDASAALDATDKLRILEVLGTLLFYARAIDSTLLTVIGELATEQSGATQSTMTKLSQLLNYRAAHPDATVRFTASDMVLAIESDASYLSFVKARSRAAGYFFLTNTRQKPTDPFQPNGAVHVLCHIMREVLSSAAEAELGALFLIGKKACSLRHALTEMGHPQPATPMATDNSTAGGIATDTVKQNGRKLLTCVFIGFVIASARDKFKFTGAKAERTAPTTSPNMIRPPIIRLFDRRTCMHLPILRRIILIVLLRPRYHPRHWHRPLWTLVRVCCSPRATRSQITRRVIVTTIFQ